MKSILSQERSQLEHVDPEIASLLQKEAQRLDGGLELIASENVVSPAVLAALSSVFSNKYAEGYPGRRYYGGCEFHDGVERIACERAQQIFGADHVNVQPHSGAQANASVFLAILKPGDTILGMDLSSGGHLTHGSPVNFSGLYFNAKSYGVNAQGFIDYEDVAKQAEIHKPKLIIAGASSYPRAIDFAKFRQIADQAGAYFLVDMAHIAGLVACGFHESPMPFADFVTTTTHKTLRGPRGGVIFCQEKFAKAIDKAVFPGTQGGPLMHVIAAKAVAFGEALQPEFKKYIADVVSNARTLAQKLKEEKIELVSGGTDNHLILMDLKNTPLSGKEAQDLLARAHLTVNKNSVPGDPRKPHLTSGIRIGTPAITTRGLSSEDMEPLGQALSLALSGSAPAVDEAGAIVQELCQKYPLYEGVLRTRGYLSCEM